MAARGIALVYGGGNLGLMGIVANSCMAGGGKVFGVIPKALLDSEHGHRGLTRLEVVDSMHERKTRMAELSDGFLALPGGFGTLEELLEILTWSQLGIHGKPVALINVAGFFDPLLAMLAHARQEGFLRDRHHQLLCTTVEPRDALDLLMASKSPGNKIATDLEG